MSRIEDALARLEAAIARAEMAGANAKPAGVDPALAMELRQAREDYSALQVRTDGVASRLDATIGRLQGILGE